MLMNVALGRTTVTYVLRVLILLVVGNVFAALGTQEQDKHALVICFMKGQVFS